MQSQIAQSRGCAAAGLAAAAVFACCALVAPTSALSAPESAQPFQALLGWWIGQGRLGFKNGQGEIVTCRATYRDGGNDHSVRQSVRCASPSGNVELLSNIQSDGQELSGTWTERKYNLSGTVSGAITPAGFKVQVRGENLSANMDVLVRDQKHVVEIQFHNSTLIGLTMVFERGN